jgi:hypothetical protein
MTHPNLFDNNSREEMSVEIEISQGVVTCFGLSTLAQQGGLDGKWEMNVKEEDSQIFHLQKPRSHSPIREDSLHSFALFQGNK